MLSGINIFISYAHRDGVTLATQLHGDLAKRGHNPWLDQRRLIGGSNWSREIENALDTADVVLALLSVGSFESEVCRGEQLRSLRHHKCLIPLLVQSDVDRPIYIEARQFIDFSEPTLYTLRLDDLIHAIDHRSGAILNVVYRTTAYDTVPPLPANFVPRSVELESLRSLVLNDHQKQDVELIAVQGMGGIGKTVLVQALCRDEAIQSAFPDGIVWLKIGLHPTDADLVDQMREAARAVGRSVEGFDSVDRGSKLLRTVLTNKAVLLVLDDIWQASHVYLFQPSNTGFSRLLFSTRNKDIVSTVGAHCYSLDFLTEEQSYTVLAAYAHQSVSDMPDASKDLSKECHGLPLAAAMIGAMLRGEPAARWADILESLRKADLDEIHLQFPNYSYPSLVAAIAVSVDNLSPEVCELYLGLAVFPSHTAIPEQALETFWQVDGRKVRGICSLLVNRSLAMLDRFNRLTLHDLQRDYALKRIGDPIVLHRRLLERYRKRCSGGWHTGPNDEYFFDHLPHHMLMAQEYEDLYALARDTLFLSSQKRALGSEAPLRVFQAALQGAIAQNDVVRMGEFCLAHAHWIAIVIESSPLRAAQADDLERAWKLADLCDAERCVLWHLLLIWFLVYKGQLEKAILTVERLESKELPRLGPEFAFTAAFLLPNVLRVNASGLPNLQTRLLDENSISYLVEALAECGHFDVALEIARACNGSKSSSLASIAAILGNAGLLEPARETAESVADEWNRERAMSELASCYARARDFRNGWRLSQSITNKWWKATAVARLGAIAALEGTPDMQEAAEGSMEFALAIAGEAEQEDDARRSSSISAVDGDVQGKWNEKIDLIRRATAERACYSALAEIITSVALSKTKSGKEPKISLEQAVQLANDINIGEVRVQAFANMASVHVRVGDQHGAGELFSRAATIADTLAPSEKTVALCLLANIEMQAGQPERANEHIVRALELASNESSGLLRIAQTQNKIGQTVPAMTTIERSLLPTRNDDSLRYSSILIAITSKVLAMENREVESRRFFGAATNVARKIGANEARTAALGRIAEEQARVGLLDDALEIVNAMKQSSTKARLLALIAAEQAAKGNLDQAREGFNNAIAIARSTAGLEDIAVLQAKSGRESDARETFKEALQKAGKSNLTGEEKLLDDFVFLQPIATKQIEAGLLDDASVTIQLIHTNVIRDEVLTSMVTGQIRAGNLAEALKIAEMLSFKAHQVRSIAGIAFFQAEWGNEERGREILSRARDILESIQTSEDLSGALSLIAAAEARLGLSKKSEATLARALTEARRIAEEYRRQPALCLIAEIQIQAGFIDQGLQTTEEFLVKRAESLSNLTSYCAALGNFEAVKRLLPACSQDLGSAYHISGVLIEQYPDFAQAYSEMLILRSLDFLEGGTAEADRATA